MRRAFCVVLCFMLSGCSSWKGENALFRDRAKDYKGSYMIAPLEVPSNLSGLPVSEQYPIPEEVPKTDINVNLEPPNFDDTELS